MTRFLLGLAFLTLCSVASAADDPPEKLTPDERKQAEAKLEELYTAGTAAYRDGKLPEAIEATRNALDLARRLYPKAEFPDGHASIARGLNNLGAMYQTQGKLPDAETCLKDALAMRRRLIKGDHASVASTLSNLAGVYNSQGKLADAETCLKDALAMNRRLFKDDHLALVTGLNNLGTLCRNQGKLAEAEAHLTEGLAMSRRLFKGDHPLTADLLTGLGNICMDIGKLTEAETFDEEALSMRRRLFQGDHPAIVGSLNNLSNAYRLHAKLAAAEACLKDAIAMQKRLTKGDHPTLATSVHNLGGLYQEQGRLTDAETAFLEALAMNRRIYAEKDHPDIAKSLKALSTLYRAQGRLTAAEPPLREGIAMQRRLFKTDHPDVALGLDHLAGLCWDQGKSAEAEALFKDALAMRRRLYGNKDHHEVADDLTSLGVLYLVRRELDAAEPLITAAVEMNKRLHPGDHPDVALSLQAMGVLFALQNKPADAERVLKDSLDMRRRLLKGDRDHPELAYNLKNLGWAYYVQGKFAAAEPLYKDALAMRLRLFPGDHPDTVFSLYGLGDLYRHWRKPAQAEPLYKEALAMSWRLVVGYARQKGEGEALTLLASQPAVRDSYLSLTRQRPGDSEAAYPLLWATKGTVARVFEQRQLRARAAADPALAQALAELAAARRRRAELLLAPATNDAATLAQREADLKGLDDAITRLTEDLSRRLPAVARTEKLEAATLADLQKALPADAAMVDYLLYAHSQWDDGRPVGQKEPLTPRYLAFVVTRDKVAWVDLDTAAAVEAAVDAWREAITGGKEIPAAVPGRVRELVWDRVRKELPATVKTVYVCPDGDLCRVPWAALPGDKPGTILLEDYAVATVPHAPFLLDKLWPQDPVKNPPAGVLVVGGVKYDAPVTSPAPGASAAGPDPLLKPGELRGWQFLPGSAAEVSGVVTAATARRLAATTLRAEGATVAAVLAELPKARYAHLATHGFFADPEFRGVFRLDEKDYEKARWGERIGRAANNPLVMTGLVFAGANNPKAAGRGILTGESLIDLDLSGLELAVLSACDTGLGDVAGGEGTFGLQRAFHLAGTRNVVTSLWKVPDQPTAALMALFYRNLWEKNLAPIEALRQAQLELYRNPNRIAALAEGFRGKFDEVPAAADAVKQTADGKTHPRHWAAFTLSGPGGSPHGVSLGLGGVGWTSPRRR